MAWKPDELPAPLTAKRMLLHIDVLVEEFPPADAGLKQNIKNTLALLLNDEYLDRYEARCIRVFRAYREAGRTLDLSPGSRNSTWQACLSELAHAQNGD
jgi:hypothetical protein